MSARRRCSRQAAALAVALGLLSLGLPVHPAAAAEMVGCFERGRLGTCSKTVLAHVPFKSVVLQFVDPGRTHDGEALSRLLWREVLESISDVGGAGVILAYDREGDIEEALGEADLDAFLQREYHDAALAIAAQQDAQIAVWGAVLSDGDQLFVQPFLSLRQSDDDAWTSLSLILRGPDDVVLSAPLGRSRLNLAPLRGTRSELFARSYVTRCKLSAGCPHGVALRAEPSNDAPAAEHVPIGSMVEVVGSQREWLKVARPEGVTRWINIYHVEMFPRRITFERRRGVNLRSAPGGEAIGVVDLDGTFEVLGGQRFGQFDEPWYRITVGGQTGWIAGRLVDRRSYTFPAVHLIAALYRYGRGQYDRAAAELEAFLAESPSEDNVTRALALRFLSASRVAGQDGFPQRVERAIADLDAAIDLTPFDAGVYTQRAVVRAGARQPLEPVLADLQRAFELDHRDTGALRLLVELARVNEGIGLALLAPGHDVEEARIQLQSLELQYLETRGDRR